MPPDLLTPSFAHYEHSHQRGASVASEAALRGHHHPGPAVCAGICSRVVDCVGLDKALWYHTEKLGVFHTHLSQLGYQSSPKVSTGIDRKKNTPKQQKSLFSLHKGPRKEGSSELNSFNLTYCPPGKHQHKRGTPSPSHRHSSSSPVGWSPVPSPLYTRRVSSKKQSPCRHKYSGSRPSGVSMGRVEPSFLVGTWGSRVQDRSGRGRSCRKDPSSLRVKPFADPQAACV